jgi:hypothetical protein
LGLHIEQLRMVPGNGIQGTYAEMRLAVTRGWRILSNLGI